MSPRAPAALKRTIRLLQPAHQHSPGSAAALVMAAVACSRGVGFLRESYIAWAFGATRATDAYVAAFTVPNILVYMLAGGSMSTTFITIYTRSLVAARPEEGDRTFSVVVTVMIAVFGLLIVFAEIWARPLCALLFPHFGPDELTLTTSMTRILLPMELCIYIGSVVQGVLYARRLFLIPAITPIVFNVGIIAGGVLLSQTIGIHSLAIGALTGAAVGPLGLASIASWQAGVRYRSTFDIRNPAFREWAKLTLPLMIGVSLVSADDWIIRVFASSGTGAIARLNYAKRLFGVPSAILGQAVGQASLPFFSQLFEQGRLKEFGARVNGLVSRVVCAGLLVSAMMMAGALPAVDLVYRRGRFSLGDSQRTAAYFFLFSGSLFFWGAQGLYSRAFYSASDTLTPMVATTLMTLLSLPVYSRLFALYGIRGLAVASDVGIAMNTMVLAVLLHWRGHVRLWGVRWREFAKALVASVLAGAAALRTARLVHVNGTRLNDVVCLTFVMMTWLGVSWVVLFALRSRLPHDLLARRGHRPIEGLAPDSSPFEPDAP